MTAYVAAKLNLVQTMPNGAHLVLNLDDAVTAALSSQRPDGGRRRPVQDWDLSEVVAVARAQIQARGIEIMPFSLHQQVPRGACLTGDTLTLDGAAICERSELRVPGEHNVSNMLAAAAISRAAGASLASIRAVAKTFQGVPHRLEVVAARDGVTWINDSIATAPERAVAALRSFDDTGHTVILLAGGKDKNLPWDVFAAEVIDRVQLSDRLRR